jgi:hypothetical protein
MQARAHTNEDRLVTEFIAHVNGAGDGPEARDAYREGFTRLRSQLQMYPASGRHASVVFESAATTARNLAAPCLPLGIAVAMHRVRDGPETPGALPTRCQGNRQIP